MTTFAIFVAGLVLTLVIAWCLGANDAANPTDCAVGSGVISLRTALVLFSIFVFIGAVLQGHMVMKTLSRGIVEHVEFLGAFSVVLSIVIWLVLCTWKGLPVSTTHATIGAVIGYGFAAYGFNLNLDVIGKVFLGVIFSPLLSLAFGFVFFKVLNVIFRKFSPEENFEKLLKYLLVGSLASSAYSFGANDVGNATGVYVSITEQFVGLPTKETMLILAFLGAAGISLGGFTWGYRVIQTVGYGITRLTPLMGLAAELSNAFVVWGFTTVPYILFGWGLPVSTTHSSVGSIIGVGLALGKKTVSLSTVLRIILAWILTLPCTIILSFIMFKFVFSLCFSYG
ncbi:MAG: anion permease [Candidatus Bathyarchaeota archaeon]